MVLSKNPTNRKLGQNPEGRSQVFTYADIPGLGASIAKKDNNLGGKAQISAKRKSHEVPIS